MFILTARYEPNYSTIADLRSVLFSWVTEQQSNGRQFSLALDLWAESGAAFRIASIHDSVADAWDKRGIPASPETPTRAFIPPSRDTAAYCDKPPSWTLHELVLPAKMSSESFIELQVSLIPNAGQQQALRTELEEWVGYRQSQGEQMSLVEKIWSGTGPEFQLRIGYRAMVEADEARTELSNDPRYADVLKKLGPLISAPPNYLLQEMPIPWKAF